MLFFYSNKLKGSQITTVNEDGKIFFI